MITANNYATQAIYSLLKNAEIFRSKGSKFHVFADTMDSAAGLLNNAVHFAVPDRGLVIDDNLKGMENTEINLPYPIITVEYYIKEDPKLIREGHVPTPKRVIFALQVDQFEGELNFFGPHAQGVHIVVGAVLFDIETKEWFPAPVAWGLFKEWYKPMEGCSAGSMTLHSDKNPVPFYGRTMAMMNEDLFGGVNPHVYLKNLCYEVRVLFELCESLACSNVFHGPREKVSPSVNAKRIRNGKLPLQETHILTLDVYKKSSQGSTEGYVRDRSSPRQHLRRGHIRVLHRGDPEEKKIWINSCVVGEYGRIDKSYKVIP